MNNNLDGNNENSNIDNELGQDQITEKENPGCPAVHLLHFRYENPKRMQKVSCRK